MVMVPTTLALIWPTAVTQSSPLEPSQAPTGVAVKVPEGGAALAGNPVDISATVVKVKSPNL
jgi:hypothetical protein